MKLRWAELTVWLYGWVGGARPKNRRWNTWRPDDEGNTPVPLSALDKPPFPFHKSSIFWAFASSPLFLEFNTWVEDPEVDQRAIRHTFTMVECVGQSALLLLFGFLYLLKLQIRAIWRTPKVKLWFQKQKSYYPRFTKPFFL